MNKDEKSKAYQDDESQIANKNIDEIYNYNTHYENNQEHEEDAGNNYQGNF